MTDLGTLVAKGAVPATAEAVAALDPAGRRAAGEGLTAVVRSADWWTGGPAIALAIAAVGCLPSAAKAAAILGRRGVWLNAEAARRAIETAQAWGVGWLGDLANRLAGAANADQTSQFVAALIAHEKIAPPTTDAFVRGWVVDLSVNPRAGFRVPMVDRLRDDPFLDALLPRVFEIDGLGAQLDFAEVGTRERGVLPAALVTLAAEGRLDRATLLDRCLGRLLRGDRPPALRGFIALHDRLAPTPDEVAAHANDYVRLLEDAPAAVATMAQKALRGASGIELDVLLDASRTVLDRADKPLVRAQLTWLDRLARQHPDRTGEIAAVAAAAVEHPAAEVRDRAAALAAKLGHGPAPSGPARVAIATGDDLAAPAGPTPAPPPITDPDELAAEVAALLEPLAGGRIPGALPLERVVDGLVRLACVDQVRLGRALAPVLDRYRDRLTGATWDRIGLHDVLGAALHAGAGIRVGGAGRWRALLDRFRALPGAYGTGLANPAMRAPQRLLWARLAEIGERAGPYVRGAQRAGLVCAPTSANGALDPEALYDRLAALGGREPWPYDLTQALLRLPPVVDEPLAARAATLRTMGGDRLADWLRSGGLPAPDARAVTVTIPEPGWATAPVSDRHVVLVETTPPAGHEDPFGLLAVRADAAEAGGWAALWPAVLPGYRDLVAAFVLPDLAGAATTEARGGAAVLPAVAECTDRGERTGVALAIALAYGLAARHEPDRIAALDALLHLAGAGELDAPAVGFHVGELTRQGGLTPSRILGPLRAAATAGARLTTWRILAAALPPLLALPKAPTRTPDLLTLAAETAAATGCRIEVPGLAEVAARAGSGRLVTEARRLERALS